MGQIWTWKVSGACEVMLHLLRACLYFSSINFSRYCLDAGGEAQSKHKEGFDPLKCSLCVKRNWPNVRYGAGPSLRTVA